MSKPFKLLTLGFVLALVPLASAQVTSDLDGDGIPDLVESEVCGRAAVRELVNDPQVPYHCASSTDLEFEAAIVDGVVDEVEAAVLLVDADSDAIPDALEPLLCGVENQNSAYDGTCIGTNYAPPSGEPDVCADGAGVGGLGVVSVCPSPEGKRGGLAFLGLELGQRISILGYNIYV